jgi:hypothetical protein
VCAVFHCILNEPCHWEGLYCKRTEAIQHNESNTPPLHIQESTAQFSTVVVPCSGVTPARICMFPVGPSSFVNVRAESVPRVCAIPRIVIESGEATSRTYFMEHLTPVRSSLPRSHFLRDSHFSRAYCVFCCLHRQNATRNNFGPPFIDSSGNSCILRAAPSCDPRRV